MARFLVVVPPFAGHVNPTISVGRTLLARGHDVAWCGVPGLVDPLLPPDLTFLAAGPTTVPAFGTGPDGAGPAAAIAASSVATDVAARGVGRRGAGALQFLWADVLLPLAREMIAGVEAAVAAYRPDVLVVDQQALAGAVVGRRLGLPWATSATTSAELTDPLAALPKVDAWVRAELVALQEDHGVDPVTARSGDLRMSDHVVLAFTTEAFVGTGPFPPQVAFVGPSFTDRADPTPFPWAWLDPARAHVLISLGTLNADAGDRFFGAAIDALAGTDRQAIVVADPDRLAPALDAARRSGHDPANVLVAPRVPQVELLPHLHAVISHGGHNTVCEALAHGVPLVVAPIRDDQPIVADQVVRAGAGVRLKFGRARAEHIRAALDQVLTDPTITEGARAVQRSFAAAGGAPLAVHHLEELACASVR